MPSSPRDKRRARSLKIKCPSWDHVEAFYARKLKQDNKLPIRVPFPVEQGSEMTIALELPNELVMAIDGSVTKAAPAADGKRTAIQLTLHGMTPEVLERLKTLVADAREGHAIAEAGDESAAEGEAASVEPPTALPPDAPVDELITPPPMLRIDEVAKEEREVFAVLDKELRQLRECAAHEVLGVAWDASVDAIRAAYFRRTKRYHPDIYSRYRSAAIRHLAQEVFIHVNRAYDRMRDAAVAAGGAIVAGPALLPHDGWLADFDDIGEETPTPMASSLPQHEASGPVPVVRLAAAIGASPAPAAREPEEADPAKLPTDLPPTAEPDLATPQPVAKKPSEPVVTFATPKPASAAGTDAPAKKLSEDSLFGDIDLGSRPDMKLPTRPKSDPALKLASASSEKECRDLLAQNDFAAARERLAVALRQDPRNRTLRALYHVSNGRALLAKDEAVQATAQFEAALAHDRDCEEAKAALEEMRQAGSRKGSLFRRLFK